MAPEVASGRSATAKADVFSLGATLYATVFGGPPVGTDGNPHMIRMRAQALTVEIPRTAGPLKPVLEAMMARDPATRPTPARAAELLRVAAGDALPPAGRGAAPSPSVRRWPPSRC